MQISSVGLFSFGLCHCVCLVLQKHIGPWAIWRPWWSIRMDHRPCFCWARSHITNAMIHGLTNEAYETLIRVLGLWQVNLVPNARAGWIDAYVPVAKLLTNVRLTYSKLSKVEGRLIREKIVKSKSNPCEPFAGLYSFNLFITGLFVCSERSGRLLMGRAHFRGPVLKIIVRHCI